MEDQVGELMKEKCNLRKINNCVFIRESINLHCENKQKILENKDKVKKLPLGHRDVQLFEFLGTYFMNF